MEFIYEIENNLPADVCNIIIEKFEQDPRKFPGKTVGGVIPDVKRSTDLRISSLPEWTEIDTVLYKALQDGLQKYHDYLAELVRNATVQNRIFDFFQYIKDTGYQLQRVKEGEFYVWHYDESLIEKRLISCIWYLNTIKIEDGGSTDFICGRSIQPVQGKLIFFPATWTYIHRGQTVKNTTKYICTTFICEKDPDDTRI